MANARKFLQGPFSRDQVKVLRVPYDVSGITFVESGVSLLHWVFLQDDPPIDPRRWNLALTAGSLRRPGLGMD